MSDSHKARYGTSCKHWKDTVLASRCQKRAWSRAKRRMRRQVRLKDKTLTRKEVTS